MSVEEAEMKKTFFAKAYFLSSLATFSFVIYQVKKGRVNWLEKEGLISENNAKLSPGKLTILLIISRLIMSVIFSSAFQYAQMLGIENATIVRIKGTEVLGSKEYHKESFNVDEHILEEENSKVDKEKQFLRL